MTHSYQQGSFPNGDKQFEAAKNTETDQVRTLEPLPTFYSFTCGVTNANQTVEWEMPTDLFFESFWIHYANTPSGTVRIDIYSSHNVLYRTLNFNTQTNGEKFENSWAYNFDKVFTFPKGYKVRLIPSVNINGVAAYGKPCLLFDAFEGVRIS